MLEFTMLGIVEYKRLEKDWKTFLKLAYTLFQLLYFLNLLVSFRTFLTELYYNVCMCFFSDVIVDYVPLFCLFFIRIFEQIVRYCEKYGNLIPVSFVLGFYVSIVVGRWWDQYKSIPWPDAIAVFVSANIQGQVN